VLFQIVSLFMLAQAPEAHTWGAVSDEAFQSCIISFERAARRSRSGPAAEQFSSCVEAVTGECGSERTDTPIMANCPYIARRFLDGARTEYITRLNSIYDSRARQSCAGSVPDAPHENCQAAVEAEEQISILLAAEAEFSEWSEKRAAFCGLQAYGGREAVIRQSSCRYTSTLEWTAHVLGLYVWMADGVIVPSFE
jgi:hypothetical protein